MAALTRRGSAPTGRPSSLDTLPSVSVDHHGTSLELEEATIRRSLSEAASALTRIRDGRLYLEADYSSFDTYCTDRLGFGRGRADQIIAAGRTLAALPTNVGSRLNEAQVRALGPVAHDPILMEQIIDAATTEGGKLTAAAITTEVAQLKKFGKRLEDEIKLGLTDLRDLIEDLTACGATLLAAEVDRVVDEAMYNADDPEIGFDGLHLELQRVLDCHAVNVRRVGKTMAACSVTFANAFRVTANGQTYTTKMFGLVVDMACSTIARLRAEGRQDDAARLADGIIADINQTRDQDGRYGPSNIPSHLLHELFSEVAR